MSAFQSIEEVLAGESGNGDPDQSSGILRREETECQGNRRDVPHLRRNSKAMVSAASQGPREQVETKEAVFESNLNVSGATDRLPQTKISCMGNPKDQAPVRYNSAIFHSLQTSEPVTGTRKKDRDYCGLRFLIISSASNASRRTETFSSDKRPVR